MKPPGIEHLKRFVKTAVGAYDRLEELAGDASVRTYWRVYGADRPCVVCYDSGYAGKREAEYPFFIVAILFSKADIPVPRVYARDNKSGLILLEDGGDDLLQAVGPRMAPDALMEQYRRLIDVMLEIQSLTGPSCVIPYSLAFDVEKLMFEFDFFIEHALKGYFRTNASRQELKALRTEFLTVSRVLHQPEFFVLNHRDFHSRNVLLRGGVPLVLDFQDARMGLPQYDAVSLLRDSYQVLDEEAVSSLKEYHFQGLRRIGYDKMSREEYDFYFDVMGFQRNVKALGTFGYQIVRRGNTVYEAYIRPTAGYLPGYVRRREELRGAGNILSRYIQGAW